MINISECTQICFFVTIEHGTNVVLWSTSSACSHFKTPESARVCCQGMMASWKKVCHLTADSGAPWSLLMGNVDMLLFTHPYIGFAANANDQRSTETVRFCCSTCCKRHLDYRRVLDESICMYLQRRPGQFEVGQWQVQESHCLLAGQNIRNESWRSISVFFSVFNKLIRFPDSSSDLQFSIILGSWW